MINAYIINLERAPERWQHMQELFYGSCVTPVRTAAIDGNSLSLPDHNFDEERFHQLHGRETNIFEVACYYSHLKSMQEFLETPAPYAIICEDDLFPQPHWEKALQQLLESSCSCCWDLVRLSGLARHHSQAVASLGKQHQLCIELFRLKGAGAYLLNRKAATAFLHHALPMWLPWDHAIDREWAFGKERFRALSVSPFLFSQTDEKFKSAIQVNSQPKRSSQERWRYTYPYQAQNELSRWIYRGWQLATWKTC